jgi:uncharacterized protein
MADIAITHIEIPAPDLDQACGFYEAVFGWTIVRDDSFPDYPMFQDGSGQAGGGFVKDARPSTTPGIVPYINVADIEATLATVEAHGGRTVMGKTEIAPGMGSSALFADPVGNQLGLYEPAR